MSLAAGVERKMTESMEHFDFSYQLDIGNLQSYPNTLQTQIISVDKTKLK